MSVLGVLLTAVVIAVGLVGILLPLLPGLLLVNAAILVWALFEQSTAAWWVLGFSVAISVAAQVAKYLVPGRAMTKAGVPPRALAAGAVLGIVGFFVLPVVGLPLGFVLGVYAAERARLSSHVAAWRSTLEACKAVGWSILIELAAGVLAALVWGGTALWALLN